MADVAEKREHWSIYAGDPSCFQLSQEQVFAVIEAAEIQPMQLCEMLPDGTAGGPLPYEQSMKVHAFSIMILLRKLEEMEIFPPSYKPMTAASAEQLLASAVRLRKHLQHPGVGQLQLHNNGLANFANDLNELIDQVEFAKKIQFVYNRRQLMKRLGGSNHELFIRHHLTRAYREIFGQSPRVSRPGRSDDAGGSFVRFGEAFFREIGDPLAKGTIARALKKRARTEATDLYHPYPEELMQPALERVKEFLSRKLPRHASRHEELLAVAREGIFKGFEDGLRSAEQLAKRGCEEIVAWAEALEDR